MASLKSFISGLLRPKARTVLLHLLVLLNSTGCAFLDLEREVRVIAVSYGISGKVVGSISGEIPIVVLLHRVEGGLATAEQYMITDEQGVFSFIVPEGTYAISAFADANWDQAYTDGEWFGMHGSPDPIVIDPKAMLSSRRKGVRVPNIELTVMSGYPDELPREANAGDPSSSWVRLGPIISWDDPILAPERGIQGFWKPLSFLKDTGYGIYFLEPFDLNKIPVLFVHGANGTPAGWREIASRLDRSRFQPWLYYYPTGLRIEASARVLTSFIRELHRDYNFSRLHVIAQSMGGLVSRSFIVKLAEEQDAVSVDTFISISTPWGGINTASLGIKQAPAVIPSWYDVAPDSNFLEQLYSKPLPEDVRFYLLFGVRGECSMLMGNNDGTVEIASEIDYRAQDEAERIFGFDEDHGSIIENQRLITLIMTLLSQ